jgi:hypothetical protein
MVDGAGDARLALEARGGIRGGVERLGQELERDVPAEARVSAS